MTKNKRFTPRLYETGELFLEDNETNCFYRVEDSFGNVELLCERLNKLVGENGSLKQELDYHQRMHNKWKDEALSLQDQLGNAYNENERLKSRNKKLWEENYLLKEYVEKENKQLKQQIKIFEKFLNENNLDIDWEIFCTVDECKKDSDDYGCKECKYLGDVE